MKIEFVSSGRREREFWTLPLVVREDPSITAYIVMGVDSPDGFAARQSAGRAERRDTLVLYDNGWNGSYHDAWFAPATERWIAVVRGKRAGRVGRLRATARFFTGEFSGASSPQAEGRDRPNTRIALIARRIWREEGD